MAATAMSLAKTVVDGVLKTLANTAADEVAKMLGVRQDIWYIIGELDMMQSFLIAAEARRDDNIIIKTWMRQVKDLAYQIEDCLAEFHLHLENRGLFYKLRTLKIRHRIASNIGDIRAKVQEVSQRNQRYNLIKPLDLCPNATSKYVNLVTRATALVMEESELVDRSKSKDELIDLITKPDEHRKVIWVTGMGGLGKTTLVKMVYNSHQVSNHFIPRVWVAVSQQFDTRELLMNISKQIPGTKNEEMSKLSTPDLRKHVREKLQKEAYFVVLDDLWTLQAWNYIKDVFPENNKGSRIVVSTRNQNVAEACDYTREIFPLGKLPEEDSRNLLLKKINKLDDHSFLTNNGMNDVFEKIVKKCDGLPLALVTIGGLLASKPENKEEWEKLLNRLGFVLKTNYSTEPVKQILDLSYTDLPYYLKPCLLYLSIFPEDYEIKRSMLVYGWMAEGFVRERRGMTCEEVAEAYFFELINRSMILPSQVGFDGRVKSCRVHDIMRELIVAKSIDENLIFISSKQQYMPLTDNFRHLVLTDSKKFEENKASIRSVSIFDDSIPYMLMSSSSKSKLLRTLYLDDWVDYNDDYNQVVQHLQQFKHLKYIRLPFLTSECAKSIRNLRDLQTLVVGNKKLQRCDIKCNITKLHKLRHFLVTDSSDVIALDEGIKNLRELQSLKYVNIKRSHPNVVEELAELGQLKKLGVEDLKENQFEKFSASLSKLGCLCSLHISIDSSVEEAAGFLDSAWSSPPEHLRDVRLSGSIRKLPTWFSSLDNLAKIDLCATKLGEDATDVLEILPNLVLLRLMYKAFVGAKLIFKSNKFPKLRALTVYYSFSYIEEVEVQAESLPRLETLEINYCDLKSGINGIEYLRNLKKITLDDCYVANLDVVREHVGNRLQVTDPRSNPRGEAEEADSSDVDIEQE